jgi:hypothetical protein
MSGVDSVRPETPVRAGYVVRRELIEPYRGHEGPPEVSTVATRGGPLPHEGLPSQEELIPLPSQNAKSGRGRGWRRRRWRPRRLMVAAEEENRQDEKGRLLH